MWQLSESCWGARLRSVGLASSISLGAEVGGRRAGLGKVAGKDGLEEGAEDDLSASAEDLAMWSAAPGNTTYPVWGSAIQRTSTNLKV